MFFVPAPANVPDGSYRRLPARCNPSMIRAPPSRPVPAAIPTRVIAPVTSISIATSTVPSTVPTNAPQVTAAAVAVAAAVAAAAVVAPAASPKEVADVIELDKAYESVPSTPNANSRLHHNSHRRGGSHLKSIEHSRPDGAHLTSAAMIPSAEATPTRRELYYGAPPTTHDSSYSSATNSAAVSTHSSPIANPVAVNAIAAPSPVRKSVATPGRRKAGRPSKPLPDAIAYTTAESAVGVAAPPRTRTRTRKTTRPVQSTRRTIGKSRSSDEEDSDFEPLESDEEEEPKATRRGRKARIKVSNVDDSVRSYLTEIGEVKLLDADTEVDLARQISKLLQLERLSAKMKQETGADPAIEDWATASGMDIQTFRRTLRFGLRAKEHMVAANLRLVVSIAKKYVNRGLTFQDLIQEGSIGLIRGAEKFDGDKGFKFSTYATWWIRQAITRAIADHSRPIRLPVHVNDTISSISKTSKILEDELGRPPVENELAASLQISVDKLRFILKSSRATISLETPIAKDGKESNATLGSFIVWDGDTPEETAIKSLLREDLENVLNTLTPRERDVVRMRYGFDDGRMKTLEEIGATFEVTRERIRQIEAKALRKLRHPNRNAVLREYVYEEL